MKTNTLCLLMVAATLTSALQPVQAGEKENHLIAGLVGGWILHNVANHSSHERAHRSSSVEIHTREARPPVIVPAPHHHPRPAGRYETQRITVWVPGHHDRVVGRYGQVEMRWVPGHHTVRTETVWVSHGPSHPRGDDHGRYSRGPDYGRADHGRSMRR